MSDSTVLAAEDLVEGCSRLRTFFSIPGVEPSPYELEGKGFWGSNNFSSTFFNLGMGSPNACVSFFIFGTFIRDCQYVFFLKINFYLF